MKTNIKSQIEAAIKDNKKYIKAFGGNIREYFDLDYANQDQGHCLLIKKLITLSPL